MGGSSIEKLLGFILAGTLIVGGAVFWLMNINRWQNELAGKPAEGEPAAIMVCSECKTKNAANNNYCCSCGDKLDENDVSVTAQDLEQKAE